MKKLMSCAFTVLSLLSMDLLAVKILRIEDHGNGVYVMQRESRGSVYRYQRQATGAWVQLNERDSSVKRVSSTFASSLQRELDAYILGQMAAVPQQPFAPQQAELAGQALELAQHGEQQELAPAAAAEALPQVEPLVLELQRPAVEEDVVVGEDALVDNPEAAVNFAGGPAHERPDVSAEGGERPAKRRNIEQRGDVDYALIGRLAAELDMLSQQPVHPVAQPAPVVEAPVAQQIVAPEQVAPMGPLVAGQQVVQQPGQPVNDWAQTSVALEEYLRNSQKTANCLVQ